MNWTERYLAAALRSIPEPKRADVERELRSSIEDGIEECVAAGEERTAAERAVLEGLGNPALLASGYTGKPNYLIGPALYPVFQHVIPRLILVAAPIAIVAIAALKIVGGAAYTDAIAAGISTGINVVIQLAFWGTLFFVFIERADAARETREEIAASIGEWKVEHLPEAPRQGVSVGDTIGEIITVLLTAGGLLLAQSLQVAGPSGPIPVADPDLGAFWIPFLLVTLVGLGVIHALVYAVGRWTMKLVLAFAAIEIAFASPFVWLSLNGMLINPAFASHIGWPQLADGNGPVMLAIAVLSALITAWEIFDAYRKARRAQGAATLFGASARSA